LGTEEDSVLTWNLRQMRLIWLCWEGPHHQQTDRPNFYSSQILLLVSWTDPKSLGMIHWR
jgi:hypothetical protein